MTFIQPAITELTGLTLPSLAYCTPALAPAPRPHIAKASPVREAAPPPKGNWLAEAGFDTGTPVDVRVLPGYLILTVKPPSTEPEVMQALLRQVCGKLSARKQRQIVEFIQVIAGPQKRAAKV